MLLEVDKHILRNIDRRHKMATFLFNFDLGLDSSTADNGALEPAAEQSRSVCVGEWRNSTDARGETRTDRHPDCQCGILNVSESDIAELCRPSGVEAGPATTSYYRELVQLSDRVGLACLTKTFPEPSVDLTKEGTLQGEGPCCQLSVVQRAQEASSDLIAGVYEGGMKIWECALDLAKFLLADNALCSSKRVMELGCGVGLPGVCALLQGARLVAFQDYNVEVLRTRTIPTVFCNGALKSGQFQNVEEFSSVCQFCYGDWGMLVRKMSQNDCQWKHAFDVILASETIYCRDNYHDFLSALKYFLEPSGVVYLAAKSYYFGVGGSVAEFQEFVTSDGFFDVNEVADFGQDTVHRTILMLSARHQVCVQSS